MADIAPAELLEVALVAAHEAGRLLIEGRAAGRPSVQTKSTPTDVVTAMDRAAEESITATLSRLRPEDGMLGEEGTDTPGRSGIRWVVDPLDGTVNYLYDIGGWAVSIAAQVEAGDGYETLAGVVYVPTVEETFAATRGGGATCNGRRLQTSSATDLGHALVATGFGYDPRRRAHQAEVLRRVLPAVRDIRRHGACAVDLCMVAAGRVDAYYERGVKLWDFAAGALIATEAGAQVAGLDGAQPSSGLVLAAPPALFGVLAELLVAAGAESAHGYAEPLSG